MKNILCKTILTLCVVYQCIMQIENVPTLGKVSGKTIKVLDKYVYAYLGIPFASPPIGMLRFHQPQPAKSWNYIYNATQKSPSCMQDPFFLIDEWERREPKNISEDCLYLNIWVPTSNAEEKPFTTMVWIHGGGFQMGSANMDIYDGAVIASIGNVIVVNFNYRLSAFGFANFGQEDAQGNNGMLDQVMALKWIHRNIEAFGGDKDMITIYGESTGSVSIANHLISPLTKGLFKRAILQSGSNYYKPFIVNPEYNINFTGMISNELGCSGNDLLQCMKKINASEMVAAEKKLFINKATLLGYTPQTGGPFLSEDPIHDIEVGKFHDVDVLIGETKDEASFFFSTFKPELSQEDNPILNKTEAKRILGILLQNSGESLDPIVEKYLGDVSDEDFKTILENTIKASGGGVFSCPIFYLAEKLSENNHKVYHYTFNHTRTKSGIKKWMGVPHFEDVYFVFGMPFVRKDEFTKEEVEFSKRIIELWTSFAKTGKPSYTDMAEDWKTFDRKDHNSMYISLENMQQKEIDVENKCRFWKDYYHYN